MTHSQAAVDLGEESMRYLQEVPQLPKQLSIYNRTHGTVPFLGPALNVPNLWHDLTDCTTAADYPDWKVVTAGSKLSGFIMTTILIPGLGLFGVLGNGLNLTILACRYRKREVDVLEKGALLGLMALAFSDMCFCLGVLPNAIFSDQKTSFDSKNAQYFFQIYDSYYINVFIKSSTWLTMIIATARYVGICHPLRARHLIGLTATKLSIISTFVFWASLNLPELWNYEVHAIIGPNDTVQYLLDIGPLTRNETLKMTFRYLWAILGYFIPVTILAFCNICLILALRESARLRERSVRTYSNSVRADAHNKITVMLVSLVVMFILCVSPSEILHFCSNVGVHQFAALEEAMIATNVLQTVNFSCHFVLFCAVNVTFRRTLYTLCYTLWVKIKGSHKKKNSKSFRRSFLSTTRPGANSLSRTAVETNV